MASPYKPCDYDCFHCPWPDCVREAAEILRHEAEENNSLGSDLSWMADVPLGEDLKRLRQEYGLTQRQLADKIGVKRECYADWELGKTKPLPENAWKLLQTVKEMIDGTDGL